MFELSREQVGPLRNRLTNSNVEPGGFDIFHRDEALANVIYPVIPAEAGIQKYLIILDSGSPPAFARVARNDD